MAPDHLPIISPETVGVLERHGISAGRLAQLLARRGEMAGAERNSKTKPSGLSGAAIRNYAESVVDYELFQERIKPTPESGVNIEELVSLLGGEIILTDNPGAKLQVDKEGYFSISVPVNTHPVYRRMLIAHELGHYYLHYLYLSSVGQLDPLDEEGFSACFGDEGELDDRAEDGEPDDRAEDEANCFGLSLLIPASAYRNASNDARSVLEARNKRGDISKDMIEKGIDHLASSYLQVSPGMVSGLRQLFPAFPE